MGSQILRFPVLKASISAVTMESALEQIGRWVADRDPHYMSICTTHTMLECVDDPRMADIVNGAGLATPDGKPLAWIGRMKGYQVKQTCGPDLMLALCEATATSHQRTEDGGQKSEGAISDLRSPIFEKKCSHFFYGATDEVLATMVKNLKQKFPDLIVAGTYSPPFRPLSDEEKQADIERINSAKPDIVWCGLGTPKQDFWVSEHCGKLTAPVLIPVGAAFNFHAGEIKRAPKWMIACGLEWLYRLLAEPRRLWKRYLIGNTRFVFLCLKEKLGSGRFPLR